MFNFIIGSRGNGKTYGFKKLALDAFFQSGEQFVYMRRSQVELMDAQSTFMDDIADKYPGWEFKMEKDRLLVSPVPENQKESRIWSVVGRFIYLSNAKRKKSVSYSKVSQICFDEFLADKYLNDEVTLFLNAYDTIARMRDVKCYFVANSVSIYNPYFMYFNLNLPNTKNGIKRIKQDIVIELVMDEKYKEARRNSRFGKIIDGTSYGDFSTENKFVDDDKTFIAKKSQKSHYYCTVYVDDDPYALYYDSETKLIYISRNVNEECPRKVFYRSEIKSLKTVYARHPYDPLKFLLISYQEKLVRFETVECEKVFKQILARLL